MWISVGLIWGLVFAWHGAKWLPSGNPVRDREMHPRADLMMFYGSALLLQQSPEELYDQEQQGTYQKAATGLDISGNDIDFLPYPYPALVAFAFRPLTLLTYKSAYILMILINFAVLGAALFQLSSALNLGKDEDSVLVLCATASLAVYAVLLQGQVSFFVLVFFVMTFLNLRKGNESAAGLWSGLLALKPTCLPVWLFWFVIRRRWKALYYSLLMSAAIISLSFLLVGVEGVSGYIAMTEKMTRGAFFTVLPTDMPTLRALTYYFGLGTVVWVAGCLAVLAVLTLCGSGSDWEYCAVVIATILTAPHMHPQELVLLLIIVAVTLSQARGKVSLPLRWVLFSSMLVLTAVRALFGGIHGSHLPVVPVLLGASLPFFIRLSLQARHCEQVRSCG